MDCIVKAVISDPYFNIDSTIGIIAVLKEISVFSPYIDIINLPVKITYKIRGRILFQF